ncbi:probable receptor-like protein kinase At5g24010 [Amaranthus tricolor]|uniref:probable receptor-like protein kinase At5g24010 n=1 Tax=Amaranthus tricolor TaxID=29722 RepID=UPI002583D1B6|nr:probable receptor-like protein kinase At5g24010 [Amaranthus tricolor]
MNNSQIITFFYILVLLPLFSSSFTSIDDYLINCGSSLSSITDSYNRKFSGDESSSFESVKLSASRTSSILNSDSSSGLYNSARVFKKSSKYVFRIKEKGAHLVRLHFHRFDSSRFDLSNAQFHVLANGYLLLNDFSGLTMKKTLEIKEYVLWVDDNKLEIVFKPSKKSNFGFVNAIEVISAPKDLISDVAQFVDSNGVVRIDGLSKNGFETMFRVNVGGPKVTPFNDSLWRTWEHDEGFLESDKESKQVHFGGRIKYQEGGASREIAPDNVYNSARMINGLKNSGVSKSYLTWGFPITDGFKYLVRTHFCDIASVVLGSLYFNVYVNGHLAIENLDLSTITNSLASPYYADFVVEGDNGIVTVSIGPSVLSSSLGVDALLNGIEVFKISNSMDSLDGTVSAKSILRRCRGGHGGFMVPLIAAVGLLVAASVVLRKRLVSVHGSVSWSRIPDEVSEVSLKSTRL